MTGDRPGGGSPARDGRWILWLVIVVQAVWGAAFIGQTSFEEGGSRVFCLMDDAMISMAYARNFAEGFGLDWSRRGDPVEGFTHPLWLGLLVLAQHTPFALEVRSLVVQVVGLALWIAIALALWRFLARTELVDSVGGRAAALVLGAWSYAMAHWSLLGMETALQALLLVLLIGEVLALSGSTGATPTARRGALGALGLLLFLLRMDMLPIVLIAWAWLWWHGRCSPTVRRELLLAVAILAAGAAILFSSRWLLFHDLLPNTYYLKISGIPLRLRLERGAEVLLELLSSTVLLWIAAGLGLVARRKDSSALLLGIVVLSGLAYSVWVGGDVWDRLSFVGANRFIAPYLPLAAVLAGSAIQRLAKRIAPGTGGRPVQAIALLLLTLTTLVSSNAAITGERAAQLRRVIALAERPDQAISNQIVYTDFRDFQTLVRPSATVATVWAGIPAYFSDYRLVDLLGYSDRRTAQLAPHLEQPSFGERYMPGHMKWDYGSVVATLRPDAFFQVWGPPAEEVGVLLRRAGYRQVGEYWLLRRSPNLTSRGRRAARARSAPSSVSP